MAKATETARALFEQTGALQQGHFILRSGRHSGWYFQCARVGEDLAAIEALAGLLLAALPHDQAETVVAPAMGGLVIGQEVARQARKRFVFAEKQGDGLAFRRGFTFREGEPCLVIEDVITQGGRVTETLALLRASGARPVAVGVLVDRSGGTVEFGLPLASLLQLEVPTYPADALPPELAALPAVKPGS